MECKHGTSEPCGLCAEEDAEHDREMAIQARIDAGVAAERERLTAALRSADAAPAMSDKRTAFLWAADFLDRA